MSVFEQRELTSAFHAMLKGRYANVSFGYDSFPDLDYHPMVLSTLFNDLKYSGAIVSDGLERFRLAPSVARTGPKKRIRPDYPDYMLSTIPSEGRSFDVDEDCVVVKVGEFDCPVCHENLGDLVPSSGPNVVIRFHRAHGVYFWWSIVPHCGKKLLISNSGV